jgi:hypothetical protein
MNIYFKHYCGAITEYDYLFYDCMAKVPLEDEHQALNEGWLPDDYLIPKNEFKSHWYQARQTRINLNNFQETKSTKKCRKKCRDVVVKPVPAKDIDSKIVNQIFDKYINYRGFKGWDLSLLTKLETDRKFFLMYYLGDTPIAFTFLRNVGSNDVFSTQFAWDYENPKLYLGKYANLAEIDYCIENNKNYMYLGLGYEKCCIYKSNYAGFEFWTGEEWSNDTEHYKFLCERDSKIEKTKDLEKIKRHDDENFFK